MQNIYCTASHGCFKSLIESNFGDVYCSGDRSCGTSVILNAKNVYCTAGSVGRSHSCGNSTIQGAHNVYFLGSYVYKPFDSIDNRTLIKSKGDTYINNITNKTMNVYFGGYLVAHQTAVYCMSDDICNIYCLVNGACDDTTEIYCINDYARQNCHVYCDFNDSSVCPLVYYPPSPKPTTIPSNMPSFNPTMPTQSPTDIPTATPSSSPSVLPTTTPTSAPTVPPSEAPTEQPTVTPSQSPSAVPSQAPTVPPTRAPTSVNDALIESFNNIALYLVFIFLIIGVSVMIVGLIFHKIVKKGSDLYAFMSVFKFFQQIGDFYTDVIFAATLFVNGDNELGIASTIFVVIPYLMSCVAGIYFVSFWNSSSVMGGKRLTSYLKKYDVFIYGLTTLAGFYSAIELCRSKLFYLQICNFQLKRSELQKLQNGRFINIVVMENLPQFMIQVFYLASDTSNVDVTGIVYISMTFSVLSIVAASLSQISRLLKRCFGKSLQFTHKIEITGEMDINGMDICKHHAFGHSKLETCVSQVLSTCHDYKLWEMRSDVEYNVEIYYIQNFVAFQQIKANFLIEMFAITNVNHLGQKLEMNVNEMGKANSINEKRLKQAIVNELSMPSVSRITFKDVNVVVTELNNSEIKVHGPQNSVPKLSGNTFATPNGDNDDDIADEDVVHIKISTTNKEKAKPTTSGEDIVELQQFADHLQHGNEGQREGHGVDQMTRRTNTSNSLSESSDDVLTTAIALTLKKSEAL